VERIRGRHWKTLNRLISRVVSLMKQDCNGLGVCSAIVKEYDSKTAEVHTGS